MIILIYAIVLLKLTLIGCINHKKADEYDRAMLFLEKWLNPSNCSNQNYAIVEMGGGGGFASQFQMASADFLRAATYFNYSIPILILGHIRGYSDGHECDYVHQEWTCFFLPTSTCAKQLIDTGKPISWEFKVIDDTVIPGDFKHMGLGWWWGVIQSRLFRLQPHVEMYIAKEALLMNDGRGFPHDTSIAGLHVRHGDKSTDGFKDQSFIAEMAAVRKSPECIVTARGRNNVSNSDNTTFHPPFLKKEHLDEDVFCIINGTTHDELPIFVASDDPHVLVLAKTLGHLVDSSGVSQTTGGIGMLKTLVSHPELGYNASLEIITDIYFLSHCSTLVGIAASQIFRMAVGMSDAKGILAYVAAMDYSQLGKILQMSAKYHLPVPETFDHPH